MAKKESKIVHDFLYSSLGGMDSGRSPSLIDPDQVSYAENCSMRGGYPGTRPGFPQRLLVFDNDEEQDWYENHRLQGGFTYRSSTGVNFDVVSVGGRFFRVNILGGYKVSEITPTKNTATSGNFNAPAVGASVNITMVDASVIFDGYPIKVNGYRYMVTAVFGNVVTATNLDDPTAGVVASGATVLFLDPNSSIRSTTWFEQARKWLIGQNGLDGAVLFDGGNMRRAVLTSTKPEVPTGTVMAFTNNRLWVAVPGNQVAAGDIAGGPTDVIVFSEELGIAGPARFQFDDEITAMVKTITLDASLGQGPLQIFSRGSVGSINVPAQRALWNALNYAIQTVSLNHSGAVSQYACLNVNSDIHYRAPDGWRTMMMSRREENSEWGNVPVSSEMNRILGDDEESMLEHTSAMLIDNRVLFTYGPKLNDNGVVHTGMIALDFNLISRMGQKTRPIWEGVWTGIRPVLLLAGEFNKVRRGFVYALSEDDKNILYEVDKRAFDDDGTRITSRIESRSHGFANSGPFDLKKISSFELWVRSVRGNVDFDLKWRPDASEKQDEAPCWYPWSTKEICTTTSDCDQNTDFCKTLKNYKAGYRNRLGFGTPPDDDCEPQTQTPPRLGFEHQIQLTWTGHAAIRKYRVLCETVEEDVFPPCDED